MIEIAERLISHFGDSILHWSIVKSAKNVDFLCDVMRRLDISHALEIGTHRGASAVIMAQFCKLVTTIDNVDYTERKEIFDFAGCKNIRFFHVMNNAEKISLVDSLDFDFAFIDGNHLEPEMDYLLTRKCGRILFHDYAPEDPKITELVKILPKDEVEINDIMALWVKK